MTSTALRNLLSRKILYLAALTVVISACSTEGMEFNVSDQALTQDTSQAQAAENQNAQTDETSAEDTYTQDVIPQSPTEETVQPMPEEKENKTDFPTHGKNLIRQKPLCSRLSEADLKKHQEFIKEIGCEKNWKSLNNLKLYNV